MHDLVQIIRRNEEAERQEFAEFEAIPKKTVADVDNAIRDGALIRGITKFGDWLIVKYYFPDKTEFKVRLPKGC